MKHVTQLNVLFAGEPVGILVLRNQRYWFQYDAYWLQHGFDLSPETMNFSPEFQLPKRSIFQNLHGIFHDSLPDGWGLLLMDRFFKRQFNWDHHEVTPLDRLAYLGKRGMGALEYDPHIAAENVSDVIDLMGLAHDAERVLAGKSRAVLNQLRILGGSPGGARPKVTVGLAHASNECVAGLTTLPEGFSHWLVKFRGAHDAKEMGRIEKVYAELAIKAGLEVPANRLIHISQGRERENFFAVERFDRENDQKHHMLTLSGYLYADHHAPSLDYNALLTATFMLTKDIREVKRAFRLMIFNIATHNKDDHAKNFSFIHNRDGHWRLAPGYDLTFSKGMNNEHTTAINGHGHPTRKDVQALADKHDIIDWKDIVEEVLDALISWPKVAKAYQVTQLSIDRIGKAFGEIKQRLAK